MTTTTLTAAQIKTLATIPSVSAPISLLSSSLIIFMVARRKRRNMYHRLLFGLSVLDVMVSSCLMLGPLPIVKGYSASPIARGNFATCSVKGFMNQMTVAVFCYNISITLYFVLTLRFGFMARDFAKWHVEMFMHVVSVGYNLLGGLIGVSLKLFNPVGPGMLQCYFATFPPNCDIEEETLCTRGEHSHIPMLFFSVIPMALGVIFLPTCMALIFWTVWRQERYIQERYEYNNNTGNKTKEVAIQSILYGTSFFMTYIWIITATAAYGFIQEDLQTKEKRLFPIAVLAEIFWPLQGFWNFLIYIRPTYSYLRVKYPDWSRLRTLKACIFSNESTTSSQSSQRSRRNVNHLAHDEKQIKARDNATVRTQEIRNCNDASGVISVVPSKENHAENTEALSASGKGNANVDEMPET